LGAFLAVLKRLWSRFLLEFAEFEVPQTVLNVLKMG
jgi:hypothetical protein